jgi:hypothetical protein
MYILWRFVAFQDRFAAIIPCWPGRSCFFAKVKIIRSGAAQAPTQVIIFFHAAKSTAVRPVLCRYHMRGAGDNRDVYETIDLHPADTLL